MEHCSVAAGTIAFTLGRCLRHRNIFSVYVSPVFVNRLQPDLVERYSLSKEAYAHKNFTDISLYSGETIRLSRATFCVSNVHAWVAARVNARLSVDSECKTFKKQHFITRKI